MNVNIVIIFIHVYIHNNYSWTLNTFLCLWPSRHLDLSALQLPPFFSFLFPDLGNHVAAKLGEPRTYTFLLRCVAIEGQRG